MFSGLRFEEKQTLPPSDPLRADVACFVGSVARRRDAGGALTPLPVALEEWLVAYGWARRGPAGVLHACFADQAPLAALRDVPVLVDSWDAFDRLFAWDERALGNADARAASYLGAAVRSFFAQGGRRCYVVRVGDPPPTGAAAADAGERGVQVETRLRALLPGFPARLDASAADQATWRGAAHLYGLSDVSFLCLPDLAEIVAGPRGEADPPPGPGDFAEQWVTCAAPQPPPADTRVQRARAPRADAAGVQWWAQAVQRAAEFLSEQRREVQLIAALPLAAPELGGEVFALLAGREGEGLGARLGVAPDEQTLPGLASAFVQLVYPWAATPSASRLPEGLEPPDGLLAGVLARNAIERGAFRSATGSTLGDVSEVRPLLPANLLFGRTAGARHSMAERVTLLGHTHEGLRLLSDVTTALDENYRPAAVNRLVSVILRAARLYGDALAFEPAGEALWRQVRDTMRELMLGLLRAGALRGATPAEAFDVRCDRSTMSQADIDNGRVIARIQFDAALPIERITVVLELGDAGVAALAGQEAVHA